MTWYWFLLLILGALFLLLQYVTYSKIQKIKNKQGKVMPGPFPFVWSIVSLFADLRMAPNTLVQNYGKLVLNSLFGKAWIIVAEPEEAKTILLKGHVFARPESFIDTKAMEEYFPLRGIGTSDANEWARQRKHLSNGFDRSHLKLMFNKFNKHVNELVAKWKQASAVTAVDDFKLLTTDIIGDTAFGYEMNAVKTGKCDLSHYVEQVVQGGSIYLFIIPGLLHLPLPAVKQLRDNANAINKLVFDMIEKRRTQVQQQDMQHDLLEIMMQQNGEGQYILNNYQIRYGNNNSDKFHSDNGFFFLVAGTETTAVSLAMLFYEFARDQKLQQALFDEVKQVLPSIESELAFEDLDKLHLLRNAANETLRFYPPAPALMKETKEDTTIGDYFVPKGTLVHIPILSIHRDKQIWGDDADTFNVNRWSDEKVNSERKRCGFIPFSQGGHDCLGKHFAMNEILAASAKLIRHLHVELEDAKYVLSFDPNPKLMRPKGGIRLKVVPRSE